MMSGGSEVISAAAGTAGASGNGMCMLASAFKVDPVVIGGLPSRSSFSSPSPVCKGKSGGCGSWLG